MPIKLNTAKTKSLDDLRAEYIAKHAKTTDALDQTLRQVIDKHREEFQRHIASGMIQRVQFFMDNREVGRTVEDFYRKRLKDSPVWRVIAAEVRELLRQLTDYDDQLTMADWDSRKGVYSPFAVNLKPDAEKIAYKRAHHHVEDAIRTFLYRAKDKLVDLMVAYPKYKASLIDGGFAAGVFQGAILLMFERPDRSDETMKVFSGFTIKIGLKYNTSVLGNPYVQYPLTFHNYKDYEERRGSKKLGRYSDPIRISEADLQEHFDFEKWEPPVQNPASRFKTVGTGSVIVDDHKRLVLVTRTKKVKGTERQIAIGMLADGTKVEVEEQEITRAVAEIKSVSVGYHGRPDSCMAYFEQGSQPMSLPATEDEQKLTWSKREPLIRQKAFKQLVDQNKVKAE